MRWPLEKGLGKGARSGGRRAGAPAPSALPSAAALGIPPFKRVAPRPRHGPPIKSLIAEDIAGGRGTCGRRGLARSRRAVEGTGSTSAAAAPCPSPLSPAQVSKRRPAVGLWARLLSLSGREGAIIVPRPPAGCHPPPTAHPPRAAPSHLTARGRGYGRPRALLSDVATPLMGARRPRAAGGHPRRRSPSPPPPGHGGCCWGGIPTALPLVV